jgi:3-dehydroquinate synthase
MSELSELFIKTSTGGYRVKVGGGLVIEDSLAEHSVWIVDRNVLQLYSESIPVGSIALNALESEKSLKTVAYLLEKLRDHNVTRETRVVALGGGITQDLVTFAASCYMRGLRWTYFPTTMLSMVDSCIGGKSSINVGRFKNLAGNIYPPDEVIVNAAFCETLSRIQLVEGLCEAAKICYARSDEAFQSFLSLAKGIPREDSVKRFAHLINFCLSTKKHFIESDEFDQGVRQLLNFGHTFGHAIESATDYQISHGVAVGLGILAAKRFSVQSGFVSDELPNINQLRRYIAEVLKGVPGLAESLTELDPEDAFQRFLSDKKHTESEYTLIVFNSIGRLQRVKLPRSSRVDETLVDAFRFLTGALNEIQ